MKIYTIEDKGLYSKGYPYASGYGPLNIPMPFLTGKRAEIRSEFWKINPMKPGLYIDEKGTKWSDMIAVYFAPPRLVISERMLASLQKIKGKLETATEFPVAEVKAKKLRAIPPPRYFATQWNGGIEVDWHATGVEHDATGKPIIVPGKTLNHVAKLSTWNGDDVFSWINWDATHLTMLCTERVAELAAKEKWTNVRFEPVNVV